MSRTLMARLLNRLLLIALARDVTENEYAVVKEQAKGEHSKNAFHLSS